MIHNDSVVALACGTGAPLQGCVLIIGTGEQDAGTPSFLFLSFAHLSSAPWPLKHQPLLENYPEVRMPYLLAT